MNGSSDIVLLAGAAAGSEASFRVLYDRHVRSVYRYCLSICADAPGAEDASQEVWAALWNARRSAKFASTTVLPWLLVTARHKSLNWLASRSRHSRDIHHTDLAESDVSRDPLAVVQGAALRGYIDELVSSLPSIDQEIFRLCLDSGRSYDWASKSLSVSEGVIRNRLSRMRVKLRPGINSFGAS
jgi:RNA polymerase sigma factor (sigma-70 family)